MSDVGEVRVTSGGRSWNATGEAGKILSEVLAGWGMELNTRCGKRGLCRGCEVMLESGTLIVDGQEISAPATVKACRASLRGAAEIVVPGRSRIEMDTSVEETFRILTPHEHEPMFQPDGERDTGFAIDIGTTTVAVMLVDLRTGAVLSRAGALNAQVRFGDNVLTRIEAAGNPAVRDDMQRAIVVETLVPLLVKACKRAGRGAERIQGGCVAGNTTMLHLLAGVDPTSLGRAPFTPAFLESRTLTSAEVGLEISGLAGEVPLVMLPGISGFVGADMTAGIHASGMKYDAEPSLLVDIGTNGEMVLQADGVLRACATAAGPAFEGGGLRCGTRARDGAVSGISLELSPFRLELGVVGGGAVGEGICGSAYIDFLAQARACGLLTSSGRFSKELWLEIPAGFREEHDGERALRLVAGVEHAPVISEVDIAHILQAKAAIGAGVETLLEIAGIEAKSIRHLYLCGGFGMNLNVPHAIATGLLPGFHPSQVTVLGNTSLAGAMLALTDASALPEMEQIRLETTALELNLTDGFEDRYIDHLPLPDPD